ncbi:transposase [Gordonia malaquae]|uniref:transposase n=1 Tax=Gordonia malaquae TaxID=410332 RepID=UPI0030C79ADF
MPSIAEVYDYVVGVDTHAKTHEYVIVSAVTGAVIAGPEKFPATSVGHAKAISWAQSQAAGGVILAAVEGVGSYGRTLSDRLGDAGIATTDTRPSSKKVRRGKGKTDGLDAIRAARSVLELDTTELGEPRRGRVRDDLQVLLISRGQKTKMKTSLINALNAIVRTQGLLPDTRRRLTLTQIRSLADGSLTRITDAVLSPIIVTEVTDLAASVIALTAELAANYRRINDTVQAWRPDLLEVVGVGPVTAARILCAWSHQGRFANDGHFASLAGISPIPIGSGERFAHRLNYGGDRQLNAAIHTIVLTRRRVDEETKIYLAKRTADGKSSRAINRLLKRHVIRQIFRLLENGPQPATDTPTTIEAPAAA